MTKKRRRSVHLHVMVTPEEQALITDRMAEAGISNMGAYMRKKALYTEYRSAQEEMRQAVAVKANIDHLLGVTDGQRKKEQER